MTARGDASSREGQPDWKPPPGWGQAAESTPEEGSRSPAETGYALRVLCCCGAPAPCASAGMEGQEAVCACMGAAWRACACCCACSSSCTCVRAAGSAPGVWGQGFDAEIRGFRAWACSPISRGQGWCGAQESLNSGQILTVDQRQQGGGQLGYKSLQALGL